MNKQFVLEKLKELNEKISQMTPEEVQSLLSPYLKELKPKGTILTEEFSYFSGTEPYAWAS